MADQNNAPGHAICNRIAMQLEIGGWHDAAEYVRSAWMMSQIADLARADRAAPEVQPVTLTYTNWRGETAERTITPKRIWFGSTDWHPEPQWLLTAFDAEKKADRDFALKDFGQAPPPAAPTDNTALVEALRDARIQLEYVNEKQPRGTTTAAIARLDAALASREAPPACQQEAVTELIGGARLALDTGAISFGETADYRPEDIQSILNILDKALRALKGDQK